MKSRKSRGKKEQSAQYTIRFYKNVAIDEALVAVLEPLPQGMLRATLIEALRLGIQSLKKQGWPLPDPAAAVVQPAKVTVKDQHNAPSFVPTGQIQHVQSVSRNESDDGQSALQQLMSDDE